MSRLILASASPRRRDLLATTGLPFEVRVSGFDEATLRHLAPTQLAARAAEEKACAVARQEPDAWVLGCDTVVGIDGVALGQPRDDGDAGRMLRLLRGRLHSVITAVHLVAPDGHEPPQAHGSAISRVRMAAIDDDEVAAYVAGGEGRDKAGGYGIQGAAGEFSALERGRGDTVVGLPLDLVRRLLRELDAPFVW